MDIFDEMRRMQKEMDRMFQGFFEKPRLLGKKGENLPTSMKTPLVDLYQDEKEVIAKVELPGIDKKDIHLNVTERMLEIKAEKKKELKENKKGIYKEERSYSGFYRALPLPAEVDTEKAKAKMKDGILEVHMPKVGKISSGKRLQIE